MTRLYATVGALAIAALLGWTWASRAADPFADCRSGVVAGGHIGGPFTLTDESGKSVTDTQVFAKPALVYFGYTSCPDVCPLDNARNAQAAELLEKQGYDVTPIFISVDPARDTPAALAEYTDNFSAKLVGLTGTPEQVKTAAEAFKVYYKVPDNPGKDYEVDHTTMTYLMLPKTGFAEFFLRETTPEEMAERTGCFLKAS
ncbi:MAG: SCO family protein [Paracoccaceae bacterium]